LDDGVAAMWAFHWAVAVTVPAGGAGRGEGEVLLGQGSPGPMAMADGATTKPAVIAAAMAALRQGEPPCLLRGCARTGLLSCASLRERGSANPGSWWSSIREHLCKPDTSVRGVPTASDLMSR
jgi:hypothetical protein